MSTVERTPPSDLRFLPEAADLADSILAEALREIVVMPMHGKGAPDIIARAERALREWREATAR